MGKTFKSREINDIFHVIQNLDEQPWPVKTSYKLGKLSRVLSGHAEDFEKAQNKILRKHAKKNEDGEVMHPEDGKGEMLRDQLLIEDPEALNEDLLDIGQEEVEIEIPVKLTLEDLEHEDCQVSVNQMRTLIPVIDEED